MLWGFLELRDESSRVRWEGGKGKRIGDLLGGKRGKEENWTFLWHGNRSH